VFFTRATSSKNYLVFSVKNCAVQNRVSYDGFGMLMPNRSTASEDYRFGFNGKEKDDEVKGSGNQYDYGFRIYNPRLGKFLSVDPLTKDYPFYTPYQFSGNMPIWAIDLDGLEEFIMIRHFSSGVHFMTTMIKIPDAEIIDQSKVLIYDYNHNLDQSAKVSPSIAYRASVRKELIGNAIRSSYAKDIDNMTTQEAELGQGMQNLEVLTFVILPKIKVSYPNDGTDFNPSEVQAKSIVKMAAATNSPKVDASISVEGHTSTVPTKYKSEVVSMENNCQLSQDRADNVRSFILDKGANPSKVSSQGSASENPITPGDPTGDANRATTIKLDVNLNSIKW
jgi:RHS repeat-associated protein